MTKNQTSKKQFLEAVLAELPFSNWNEEVLFKAEENLSMVKNQHKLLFPGGLQEVVELYERFADELMLQKLSEINPEKIKKIREKIFYAVKFRIDNGLKNSKLILAKTKDYYTKKLQNFPEVLSSSWATVDEMWYFAGDKSTDYNYYTKRSLLFGVYNSTILYYLQDESKGHEASWEFLENRINDVLKIGSVKKHLNFSLICDNLPFVRQFKYYK